jgi:hypothetical protein
MGLILGAYALQMIDIVGLFTIPTISFVIVMIVLQIIIIVILSRE